MSATSVQLTILDERHLAPTQCWRCRRGHWPVFRHGAWWHVYRYVVDAATGWYSYNIHPCRGYLDLGLGAWK